jgi:hypothetical protein
MGCKANNNNNNNNNNNIVGGLQRVEFDSEEFE